MAESKTYYYLKLKENFFDSDEIKLLESMDNGYLYSNILLKMYLKSLKGQGMLIFKDYIPYNAKMLSTIVNHNVDVVEKALQIFQQLGLIEILDNGAIFMLDIQQFIGSISNEGLRKAEYRKRIATEKQQQITDGGTLSHDCPDIISISISNSNDILDYKNLLEIVKEECKTIYLRHSKHVDEKGNLQLVRQVTALLEDLQGQYSYEQLREVFRHANKTYIVSPQYSNLDIAWVLKNIRKVMETEETDSPNDGGGKEDKPKGFWDEKLNNLGRRD